MRLLPAKAYDTGRIWKWTLEIALVFTLAAIVPLPLLARAQDDPPAQEAGAAEKAGTAEAPAEEPAEQAEPQDEKDIKNFPVRNGTAAYGHTEEVEKKKTADGEIETRRVRSANYAGDRRVVHETEVRTKKLPDGSTERESVLKNPDGSGRMMPIEIIREKVRTNGETTITEREVLRKDYSGRWQPQRKERVTRTGEEKDRQSVKEVRERNLAGDWKLVDRTSSTEKSTESGKTTRAVRQTPNVYGELADFEIREERTSKDGDKETTEVNLRRRDTQDTHNPKFFLVERTKTEQAKSADGKVTKKSLTESDLVAQGASRNITAGAPRVVQEKVEVESTAADGSTRRTVAVKEAGSVNRELRPAGQIIQETDSKGNVRQILIPSR